ncbi:Ppx/GppA phosphatase family protein [Melioribacter sp. OK-6-Me]|uniref:Ppx/GppA phosphatase family protein n=1 Tax=unclassified Melioribacter TaxID=2627329 RepID=UPI003EDA76FA
MINKNLAAIDIGTNSFHLIVVKIKNKGNFEIIDREKEVIRLGEGSSTDIKKILPTAMKRAVDCLVRFKEIAVSHNAIIRAVATSAVREAHNSNEFIELVREKTGIEIEVVSGHEEARLIYLGVLKALPIYNSRTLVIDIGGGSTEFVVGLKGHIDFSVSMKLGAVRLSEKFFPDFKLTPSRIEACRRWVEGEIYPVTNQLKQFRLEKIVGTSGTIMSCGLMINAQKKKSNDVTILNNFTFTKSELKDVIDEVLSHSTTEKRKKIKGLDEKRADIIPAGVIILETIFKLLEIKEMTISGYALREGIIIDTLQKSASEKSKPVLTDIRKEAVMHLAEKCEYDREHCIHVSQLALQLYDDLMPIHKLKPECREFLEASAILHDVGYHIAHTNHHHHSYYIIKNSELLGFSENEIDIIAHTARYHRKSHPKPGHPEFMKLNEQTRTIIKKLASILRIADSFDRTHRKIVKQLNAVIEPKKVKIIVNHKKGIEPAIELWNLERRKNLFEEVFGKKVYTELIEE